MARAKPSGKTIVLALIKRQDQCWTQIVLDDPQSMLQALISAKVHCERLVYSDESGRDHGWSVVEYNKHFLSRS